MTLKVSKPRWVCFDSEIGRFVVKWWHAEDKIRKKEINEEREREREREKGFENWHAVHLS